MLTTELEYIDQEQDLEIVNRSSLPALNLFQGIKDYREALITRGIKPIFDRYDFCPKDLVKIVYEPGEGIWVLGQSGDPGKDWRLVWAIQSS